MPRFPRIHYPGAVYHVMARGVDGRDIFADDLDRQTFLSTTDAVKKETASSLLAYCLMGNHFHFAIKVKGVPLARIMQRLLTTYAMAFNFRHDRQGHLFQARYKAVLCLDDAYLIALVRYIHMNPVRAGLVETPGQWPWSSQREYDNRSVTALTDSRIFFDALGETNDKGERMKTGNEFDAWPKKGSKPPLFRDDDPDTETLEEIASDLFPDDLIMVRSGSRRRDIALKRFLIAERAMGRGHQLTSIAAWLGRSPQAVHNLIQRNKLNK
jgi:REP element-mobilizing transposase RayT